ncbi:hypothetical protein EDD86DRAFT_200361 [Gorgonomyces haynaldii]|nr:hypothetical protein EDD86DRAFT_200361 [Gorgonomyces haynaldii]
MALSVIGLIFYALWIIALQSVVFLRSLAFLHMEWERTILKIVMGVLWAVQLGLRAYQMSVLQVTSLPGEFCKTKNIGVDVSYYNFAFLMAAESALLLPFLYACFKSYIYGNAKKNAAKWIRLCVVNIAVTGSIILIEIIARILAPSAPNSPPFPQMIPYFNVMFVMINFYEANIVVLILEDLKQTMLGAYKTSKHSGGTSDTGNLSLPATSVLMNSGRSSHAGVQIFGQSGH